MPQWKQYSGIWTQTQQAQALAAGTWTGITQYELYAWGGTINNFGKLGTNNQISYSSPVQVGTDSDWEQVAAKTQDSVGIKTNGTLWAWGRNVNGGAGQDNTVQYSSPVQVGALTTWSNFASGSNSFIAIVKTDGTLWASGRNTSGELGQNDIINYSSPVQIGSDTNWATVAGNSGACFAIKTDGTLWAWGKNTDGMLGQNNVISRSSPVQIGSDTDWAEVNAGNESVGAVKTTGTLWMWGVNDRGQLGQNDLINYSSPVQVGALTTWDKVSPRNHTFAIKTDGTLWAWGENEVPGFGYRGALGDGTIISRSSPVQIGADTNWKQAVPGTQCSAAVKTDGTLWWWGWNDGTPSFNYWQSPLNEKDIDYSSPVQVGSETNWDTVSLGDYFGFATVKTTT
jgi:alpha-tubulin suppressor-like RCC1 family protein